MNENPALIHKALDSLIKNDPKNKQLKQAISDYLVDYSNKLIVIPHEFNRVVELEKFIIDKKTESVFNDKKIDDKEIN